MLVTKREVLPFQCVNASEISCLGSGPVLLPVLAAGQADSKASTSRQSMRIPMRCTIQYRSRSRLTGIKLTESPVQTPPHASPLRGIVCMVLATFAFSVMDVVMKHLSYSYPSVQVAFLRGLTALPLIVAYVLYREGRSGFKTSRIGMHVMRGLIGVAMLSAIIFAFRLMPLANVYALFFVSPFVIAALSIPMLGEKVGIHRWLAMGVGFIGVLIMVRPGADGWVLSGLLAAAVGTLGYSINALTIRKLADTESTAALVFHFTWVVTLGAGILAWPNWQVIDWVGDAFWLLALGVAATVGQHFVTEAFRCHEASLVAPFEYSAMIWALLFGYYLWGDVAHPSLFVGVALLVVAGIYTSWRESLAHPRQPPGISVHETGV